MKRIISIFLSILIFCFIFSGMDINVNGADISIIDTSWIADGTCGDNLTWTFDTNTRVLTINGTGDMNDYYDDTYITGEEAPWNRYYSMYDRQNYIKEVIISEGVTSIGAYAFFDQTSIESIKIPSTITEIREGAFANWTYYYGYGENFSNLAVHITDLVSWCNIKFDGVHANPLSFAKYLYVDDQLVCDLTLPKEVKSISPLAFCNFDILTSATIPKGVEAIETGAFYNCDNLSNVIINDGITRIGDNAFAYCAKLESITLPDGVKSIEDKAFAYCSTIKSITIPNSVTNIGEKSFAYCSELTSITLPNGVTSIANSAFRECSNLKNVITGYNINNIGDYAFYLCKNLSSITLHNNITSIGEYAFSGCTSLTNIIISDSVTSIGSYAFESCTNLSSVTLSANIEKISDYAFYGVSSLRSIVLPDNVDIIGKNAFNGCKNLKYVTIGKGTKSIGNYAFSSCKLKSIIIPENVEEIGMGAFNSVEVIIIKNSNCEIYDGKYTINDSARIYGYQNSTARAYATIYNRSFVDINNCTEHVFNEGIITQNASCISIGKKIYTCMACDNIETEIIPELGHGYNDGEITKEATCSNSGIKTYTCTSCGDKKQETIPATQRHKIKVVGKKSATYFAIGNTGKQTCKNCNKTISKDKKIAKLKLKTPKVKITGTSTTIKVKYNKVKKATGFQVKYKYKHKTTIKTYKTKKSVTKVIKKLKAGAYQVQVRAYIKSGKKKAYSDWSNTQKLIEGVKVPNTPIRLKIDNVTSHADESIDKTYYTGYLEITDVYFENDYLSVSIKNPNEYRIYNARVSFNLYDAKGNWIKTQNIYIEDTPPGETSKERVWISHQDGEITEIKIDIENIYLGFY